uniref:Homologous recombination OB-fold protein OB-fold domain-containing protein n=1 Tax=Tanacetum cinerariifolium TaxID=118510 RepID=A0A6L2MZB4_TANCI|nr:hypothetical protein [Tanacetum cinerariifolium]
MIEYVSSVKSDMVIHTTKTDMMKLLVEIECFAMSADKSDKETGSSHGLQPKQADLSCVHALNEPHLREIHVIPIISTQEYMKKVVEDVGGDEDFNSEPHQKLFKNGKLEQVVAIVKSCSSNAIGDLIVTMKDLTDTIPRIIHHKVIGDHGYGKDITLGAAMILANVLVFTHKPSKNYLNTTMRNVVKVFRKDTVPESRSGSS